MFQLNSSKFSQKGLAQVFKSYTVVSTIIFSQISELQLTVIFVFQFPPLKLWEMVKVKKQNKN